MCNKIWSEDSFCYIVDNLWFILDLVFFLLLNNIKIYEFFLSHGTYVLFLNIFMNLIVLFKYFLIEICIKNFNWTISKNIICVQILCDLNFKL